MIKFNPKYSTAQIQCTESVLNAISTHLSKKKECRKMIYRVAIGVYDEEQSVCRLLWSDNNCSNCMFFDTKVQLRSNSGRMTPAIQHIIIEHFPELWAGAANGNQIQIYSNMLVSGIYEYRQSTTHKYRRWFKIND